MDLIDYAKHELEHGVEMEISFQEVNGVQGYLASDSRCHDAVLIVQGPLREVVQSMLKVFTEDPAAGYRRFIDSMEGN